MIPNGVPRPRPSARPARSCWPSSGLPEGSRLVGLIGRLWPQKRVKDAIWAADLLKVIRDDVHLLVIGDGPQRDRLRKFRDQVRIRDKVHFLGERGDVPRLLPHFDVLWSTSGYEGQSNAIMEAMAAGVPVVATDVPGTRDLVVHGETGYLVPVGDRAGFARQTNRLLDDADLARRLGEAGRADARRVRRRADGRAVRGPVPAGAGVGSRDIQFTQGEAGTMNQMSDGTALTECPLCRQKATPTDLVLVICGRCRANAVVPLKSPKRQYSSPCTECRTFTFCLA